MKCNRIRNSKGINIPYSNTLRTEFSGAKYAAAVIGEKRCTSICNLLADKICFINTHSEKRKFGKRLTQASNQYSEKQSLSNG